MNDLEFPASVLAKHIFDSRSPHKDRPNGERPEQVGLALSHAGQRSALIGLAHQPCAPEILTGSNGFLLVVFVGRIRWSYSLVVFVGRIRWSYSLVVFVGRVRWSYSLVVLAGRLVDVVALFSPLFLWVGLGVAQRRSLQS